MKAVLIATGTIFAGASGALAVSLTDDIVSQLQRQGYSSVSVGTTFLGRVKIEATSDTLRREIVVNPRSGEILRDFQEQAHDSSTDSDVKSDSHSSRQILSSAAPDTGNGASESPKAVESHDSAASAIEKSDSKKSDDHRSESKPQESKPSEPHSTPSEKSQKTENKESKTNSESKPQESKAPESHSTRSEKSEKAETKEQKTDSDKKDSGKRSSKNKD